MRYPLLLLFVTSAIFPEDKPVINLLDYAGKSEEYIESIHGMPYATIHKGGTLYIATHPNLVFIMSDKNTVKGMIVNTAVFSREFAEDIMKGRQNLINWRINDNVFFHGTVDQLKSVGSVSEIKYHRGTGTYSDDLISATIPISFYTNPDDNEKIYCQRAVTLEFKNIAEF